MSPTDRWAVLGLILALVFFMVVLILTLNEPTRAEAPRGSPQAPHIVIPVPSASSDDPWVAPTLARPEKSDVPPTPGLVGTHPPRHATSASSRLVGVATWYDNGPGLYAAAGPALRRWLGAAWRGRAVTVCAGSACVRVRLTDWCACGPRPAGPTLLDLSRDAFAWIAPKVLVKGHWQPFMGAGVLRVEVTS